MSTTSNRVEILIDRLRRSMTASEVTKLIKDTYDEGMVNRAGYKKARVNFGLVLIQARGTVVPPRTWERWCLYAGINARTARRWVIEAVLFADVLGEIGTEELFDLANRWAPQCYASLDAFESVRVVERDPNRRGKMPDTLSGITNRMKKAKRTLPATAVASAAAPPAGVPDVENDDYGYEPDDEPDYFLDHEPTEEELAAPRPRVDRFMDDDDEPVGGGQYAAHPPAPSRREGEPEAPSGAVISTCPPVPPVPPVPPAAQAIASVPARPSLLTRGVRTAEQQLTLDSLYVEARTALRDLADKIEARILSDDDVRRVVEFLKSLPSGAFAPHL